MADASAPEKLTHRTEPDPKSANNEKEKEILPKQNVKETETQEEEDEETCAFCKFMKGGGCKDVFTSWMECVDAEKEKGNDFVETCMTQIQDLRECMLANADYYRPMLDDEETYLEEKEYERTHEDNTFTASSHETLS